MTGDIAEQVQLLHESNQVRIEALEALSPQGAGSLENAFDALKILTLLENICNELGISVVAQLDFEGRRQDMISKIEEKYAEMKAAAEAAHARQVLTGGFGGPPQGTPPGMGPRPMPRGRG